MFFKKWPYPIIMILFLGISVLAVVMILLLFFFNTSLGQAYIATGDNEEMARSIGIQTDRMKIFRIGFIEWLDWLIWRFDCPK